MKTKLYSKLAMDFFTEGTTDEILFTGLGSEAGEVLAERRKECITGNQRTEQIRDELGDVLWYVNAIATSRGFTLKDLMSYNIAKLEYRLLNPKKL